MACQTVAPVFITYQKQLLAFIQKRLKDSDTSKEVLNEVLMKVYDHCEQVPQVRNARAWLFQITRNAVNDYFRKSQRFSSLESAPEPMAEWEQELEQQIAACVRPLIQLLPEGYALPLIKSDLEGIPQQQIAEEMGLGLSAVKSRIQRGREKLKAQFHECCIIEQDKQGKIVDFQIKKGCKTLGT
ncbi:sigma-70 family RNA polymerase sigma factor [Cytophagales bacterium LB-30]|uniref:Sigma-70 family RNA polymerase sigma factor n=1 Tax=Shiella aurantiaca TaxID=3058365 RepID=A0ABT8F427_9BACT|nr:sigma-70 family RNA polymerase sigma factor [Shiella aurantiaca]MDN4165124.1 sigma-70 family RNA polymerase sigma factor [Shiella aurantiaca]